MTGNRMITVLYRLTWSTQVARTISKANRALNGLKLIRKYFSTNELISLVTSNFYSILYYNAEVWLLESLNVKLKKNLMSASGNALRMCWHYRKNEESFVNLHQISNRATPEQMSKYKLALALYRTFNNQLPVNEWLHLNNQIVTMTRQTSFSTRKINNYRIGLNILVNRFHELNGEVPCDWLNLSFNSFKIKMKEKFITNTMH